jgi:hypothetical protein
MEGEAMTAEDTARVLKHFAQAAASLAEEASSLALASRGPGHDSDVAVRAAGQAREAALQLSAMADRGASLEAAFSVAAWALSAASVAVTQARAPTLVAPPV